MATDPQTPTFPQNKRYAMHFRHRNPPTNVITARFPTPKTDPILPSKISLTTCQFPTPATIDEALSLPQCQTPPPVPPHGTKGTPPRHPLPRSQSSGWWMDNRKSPTPKDEPKSRKTNHGTIATDATENHPAFESDRFAVLTPATREPILLPGEMQAEQSGWKVGLPKPSQAQVEAYHTYKAKADIAREKDREQHVRVPSKIVSYDYAYSPQVQSRAVEQQQQHAEEMRRARDRRIEREREKRKALELGISTPNNGPTPAGSFPISPPIPQQSWSSPSSQNTAKRHVQYGGQGPPVANDASPVPISLRRKPVAPITTPTRLRAVHRNAHTSQEAADVGIGASRSTPSPTRSKIRVKAKPKYPPGPLQPANAPQKESWFGLSSRNNAHNHASSSSSSTQSSTSSSSRSQSSTIPYRYKYRRRADTTGTSATSNSRTPADVIFGYRNEDITGTMAATTPGASRYTKPSRGKDKADILQTTVHAQHKKRDESKYGVSRWGWLRPAGPRVHKLSPVPPASTHAGNKTSRTGPSGPEVDGAQEAQTRSQTPRPSGLRSYMDPFIQHATPLQTHHSTPLSSHPPSPKKPFLHKSHPPLSKPPAPSPPSTFDTGLHQITTLFSLIFKLLLIVYILVGLYFLLDAVRQAMYTLGAPFRVGKMVGRYVWVGGCWVRRGVGKGWERWGVKIALKGGWRGVRFW
ncbi:hypothetical protein P154DRAFT_580888 [Amniculicola lignicola CBS 123094]|uniref:Uncharacterized protein n=1 Tax=Amniculicola lignicola CBS 123094 TaxID=1392246 RepID=A0A6A5W8L5_9PLEO|nr:hypothetical protein P154DRAFT_580888 [Amniculicola lignicola CBS 123094]